MNLPASSPLGEAPWIPQNRLAPLARLGLRTLEDLWLHFPRRHENRREFSAFPDLDSPVPVCLCGTLGRITTRHFGGHRSMLDAELHEEEEGAFSRVLHLRWFQAHYVRKLLVTGDRIVVFGKVRLKSSGIVMDHPEFEIIGDPDATSIDFGRIVPIHPAGEGVSQKALRGWIYRALQATDPASIRSLLPVGTFPADYPSTLRSLHFPDSFDALDHAREALAIEEFFRLQAVLVSRRESVRRLPGTPKRCAGRLSAGVRASLSFQLTAGQEQALREILADIEAPVPMARLLQGDVGSGKTIVALLAAVEVLDAGWEVALMAPTQILAAQHFETFSKLLTPLGIPVRLRAAQRTEDSIPPLFARPGMPALTVGTHALLYDNADFSRLGLAIVDEQHKFGVMQRARLMRRGETPDLLVMTATPIPRTIAQTLHGDLDVSTLREKPAGRGTVRTAVRPSEKLPDITAFFLREIEGGRQAYIVYPLVEESEKLELKAAVAEAKKWGRAFAPHSVAVLHGRTPPPEKEQIMRRFRDGEVKVLVSTTVIEVGVDVPNATLLLVENAERFGLAQLHQLRGRIGRGSMKSYCALVTSQGADGAAEKLRILEQTSDGFEIAEADLQLRGPGDLLGTAQSGLPPLRIGDILRDAHLMTRARKLAIAAFENDPLLESPESLPLREYLARRKEQEETSAA